MPRPSAYWDSIHSIASEIREEYPDPDSDRQHNQRVERVTEDVDSSEWIIYPANHEEVLRETRNEPDDRDVRAMSAADASWKDMRQLAAFLAMEGDVHEELRRLDKEHEEAEESHPSLGSTSVMTKNQMAAAKRKIRKFYRLGRAVTDAEVHAEIENLKRKHLDYDDREGMLAATLQTGDHPIALDD